MSQLIASTYEIIRQIGAGGGGTVYLAKHLRLNKNVILKADKRSIRAKPETLRREVDVLKDLSHTYIPQVYDFFQEDGVVYTVMDYIEGESLDKPLKRGERFSQPQVIRWACELLEALVYLHSRPPYGILHADIKPANIMLTPQGDIRLIDFNIALALGEEGAVRVGFSRGYASPEHYSSDYTPGTLLEDKTVKMTEPDGNKTVLMGATDQRGSSSSASGKGRLLDVRSDIYSLGATLYHLFSGRRPAHLATEVTPLTQEDGVSPAVIAIIQKSMEPDPDQRYQTAAEMLWAFTHLHENDPRTIRLKKTGRVAAAVLTALFLTGGVLTMTGLQQQRRAEEAARLVAEEQARQEQEAKEREQRAKDSLELIETAEKELERGDRPGAVRDSLQALKLDTQYAPQAQYVLTDALGVYDLSDGYRPERWIALPSQVIKQTLSPSGTYAAVLTSGQVHVAELDTGTLTASVPASTSALAGIVFRGEDLLLYAGEKGLSALVPATGEVRWTAEGPVTDVALSGDGALAAAISGGEALVVDTATGQERGRVSFEGLTRKAPVNAVFADPEDDLFALDETGKYLAVSFSNGALMIYDTGDPDGTVEIFDESDNTFFEGGFWGKYFGFVSSNGVRSTFMAVDMEELAAVGSLSVSGSMRLRVDRDGFALSQSGVLVRLDVETGQQTELAYTDSGIAALTRTQEVTLVKAMDGRLLFFDRNARLFDTHANLPCDFLDLAGDFALLSTRDDPSLRVLRLRTRGDSQFFTYEGTYPHDEARVSSDRSTVMLYDYRSFRLYGMDGTLIREEAIPDAQQVYDQQYRREEGCLEVIYNDGLSRKYSAADGSLLSETQGTPHDGTLDEEFLTEHYRVEAPLHGSPVIYDRATGEKLTELTSEDYATYATETRRGLILEFITTQGERYGVLFNDSFTPLARLPQLRDILPDDTLIFDDTRGNLRESPLYSPEDLLHLSESEA